MPKAGTSDSVIPPELERNSAVPMYVQLAKAIEAHIASGTLRPGDCLESEQKLCKRLAISRVTTRLAIDELVEKGLIEKRQGKGTYVAHHHIRHDSRNLNQFLDTLFAQGHNPTSRLIAFGAAKPPRDVAAAFNIAEDEKLVQLDRLYMLEGRPVGVGLGWMMPEARSISRSQAEAQSSARLFENVLGFRLGKTELLIRADAAGRSIAGLLQIPERSPVLTLGRKRFLTDGRVAEVTKFTMNSDSYEFSFADIGPIPTGSALKILAA